MATSVDQFVRARQERWQRLEQLVSRTSATRLRGLSGSEVLELGRLYRQTTSDLAISQRDFPGDRVTVYLRRLVGQAYPQVYRGGSTSGARVLNLFLCDFPRAYRQIGRYVVAAFLMMIIPALIAFVFTLADPGRTTTLLPAETQQAAASLEQGKLWTEIPEEARPLMSSFIMTNNIQVLFLSFSGGVLLGLGTLYVLIFNGITLGAIFGLCQSKGLALGLATFIAAHGFLELSAIFASAGAGLSLGHAILSPGLCTRRDALVRVGRRAIIVILGCVPVLIVAGILEGFVSPSGLPPAVKLAVGVGSAVVLYAFLLLAGRGGRDA